MLNERTHASFFSGVGGLDLGLERADWSTVSFSEIDAYASAVLAERFPGVPNLGDIVALSADVDGRGELDAPHGRQRAPGGRPEPSAPRDPWRDAELWTGGFPCQDLSVAGKRRGMVEGTRSNLAYAFLALVERHRPPAVLLENVPGLLSSHRGRDMAVLLGRMAELGYGVAYRILDARHFGVPQRRRRVFILGLRSGPDDPSGRLAAERAAAVLAVGSRCHRHPATGGEAGPNAADGVAAGISRALSTSQERLDADTKSFVVGASPDARGVRAADGLAGRLHDLDDLAIPISGDALRGEGSASTPSADAEGRVRLRDPGLGIGAAGDPAYTINATEPGAVLAATLNSGGNDGGFRTEPGEHLVLGVSENQRGEVLLTEQAHQLTSGGGKPGQGYSAVLGASGVTGDDPLLPLGLDSHRYRCCGNGVVANVSYWLGRRLLEVTPRLAYRLTEANPETPG